jgi:hypothetical protein
MLMLVLPLIALVVALVRGGSLQNLLSVPLRWPALVLLGLGLQLVIFTPLRSRLPIEGLVPPLYLLSMLIMVGWVVLNRRVPGMLWMGIGVVMNLAAIAANGGYMPVAPESTQIAGQVRELGDSATIHNNSLLTSAPVQLWILTDILPIPAIVPFANVFSIGDVFLTLGASIFLFRTIRPKPTPGTPSSAPGSQTA